MYIDANSVTNAKGNKASNFDGQNKSEMEFTSEDLSAIRDLHEQRNLFRLIVG